MQLEQREIATDVLVIGGGMAGVLAALTARKKGLDVTLVAKGAVGKSGQTPWANSLFVFNEEWGDDRDLYLSEISSVGEYVNNRFWTEKLIDNSHARYQELVAWGATFGRIMYAPGTHTRSIEIVEFGPLLQDKVKESGARVLERVMITDLIEQGGRVVGAIGFPLDAQEVLLITAKATVLCAGAGGFKPAGFPIGSITSDGDAMAYRAGVEITGKEFVDTHPTRAQHPDNSMAPPQLGGGPPASEVPGGLPPGMDFPRRKYKGMRLSLSFEAHAGNIPVERGPMGPPPPRKGQGPPGPSPGGMVGGGASGMSVHKAEGVFPQDNSCASNLVGLYAAGDALGSMQNGSCYSGFGCSLSGSATQGVMAAQAAAAYALTVGQPEIAPANVERLQEVTFAPLREKGFGPAWVTQTLQSIMIPYYVMHVKKQDRLEAALTNVMFLQEHLVPMLRAADAHELRLAHETKNMALNAEMKLRASLFRTESRGNHYREDYPARDDDNWLAWVKLKKKDGRMVCVKHEIPKEHWPDPSIPYQERYPFRFPGELEFLSRGC